MKENRKHQPSEISRFQGCVGHIGAAIALLVFSLSGLFAVILGAGMLAQQIQFVSSGVGVSGIIMHCREDMIAEGRRKTYLTYQYTVEGQRYSATEDGWVACADFPVGTAVEIVYLPADPSQAHISAPAIKSSVGDWLTAGMLLVVGSGSLIAAFGLVLTYLSVRYEATWRQKRVL
ncbi:MAG: DUF3592 domain-containing protein [Armatimonadetes bacterium]|nr:DUF3592 domain-containing protein [Anaerolineae bacterium]